eukprot:GHRR01036374.1.p1 GENE.GHRR01036374.1~~GHRR01036374.1.p1  ORF type:complete len:183 (+),score=25.13 GHRR01036374.1:401-949(+)
MSQRRRLLRFSWLRLTKCSRCMRHEGHCLANSWASMCAMTLRSNGWEQCAKVLLRIPPVMLLFYLSSWISRSFMFSYCLNVVMMDSLIAGKAATGSLCAPPRGSGMISSITSSRTSSGAVMRSASVAWTGQRMGIKKVLRLPAWRAKCFSTIKAARAVTKQELQQQSFLVAITGRTGAIVKF